MSLHRFVWGIFGFSIPLGLSWLSICSILIAEIYIAEIYTIYSESHQFLLFETESILAFTFTELQLSWAELTFLTKCDCEKEAWGTSDAHVSSPLPSPTRLVEEL